MSLNSTWISLTVADESGDKKKNERFWDCCVAENDRFGAGSELVLAGISYDGRTDLYVIRNGALTGAVQGRDPRHYRASLCWSLRSRLYPDGWQCIPAPSTGGGPVLGARGHIADGLASEIARPQSNRTCLGHAATQDIQSFSQTKDSPGAHRHAYWRMAQDTRRRRPDTDSQLSSQMPGSDKCAWWTHTILTVIWEKMDGYFVYRRSTLKGHIASNKFNVIW